MVSLFWPHELPARDFKMLIFFLALLTVVLTWWVKVYMVSYVTPSITGVRPGDKRRILLQVF